jgi:hypothetical protein
MEHLRETIIAAHGARPVSVDLARGRTLAEATATVNDTPPATAPLPLSSSVVADRLSLAHWPPHHQIVVCSLSGGTGRTTVTGLLATILAELPFAHIWPPIAAVELTPHPLGSTVQRWDLVGPLEPDAASSTRAGAWAFTGGRSIAEPRDFSVVVLDAPTGIPSDLPCVADDPGASILLLTRPDRASLAEAAEALVWMHDQALVSRNRTVVVVNGGVGQWEQGSRTSATTLGIRSTAVHRLPSSPALGPGRALPSGRAMPTLVRRALSHAALDLWSVATNHRSAHAKHRSPQEELR